VDRHPTTYTIHVQSYKFKPFAGRYWESNHPPIPASHCSQPISAIWRASNKINAKLLYYVNKIYK